MNANIDQEICTGCKLCKETCPDVFQMDNGKAIVIASSIPCKLESTCKQTMVACPADAIHIGEATGLMRAGSDSQKRAWVAL